MKMRYSGKSLHDRFEPILLKNSDIGQNRKIFPCTELEEYLGEGVG